MNEDTTRMETASKSALLEEIQACEDDFKILIRNRLGIVIHSHQKPEFYKTISSACQKFDCSPKEYLNTLQTCPDASPLLEQLIIGITVGETYFFRDKTQMEVLKNSLLPNLIKLKQEQNDFTLRIWSAGCSSGEELYTIAILLNEILPDINQWTLTLLGTDINTTALQKAMMGQYGEWSMRSIDSYYKKKYFTSQNQHYFIKSAIRDLAKFDYLNLNDDTYPSMFNGTNAQDLILCRNVLIYFDNQCVANVINKLNASLIPGGLLMLGASDPIDIKMTDLTFHHEGILFSKPLTKKIAPMLEKPAPVQKPITLKPSSFPLRQKEYLGNIKHQAKVKKMDENTINDLLNTKQWQAVLNSIEFNENTEKSVFLLLAEATALANLGKLEKAVTYFEKGLKIDPINKYGQFIYALTLIELNSFKQAEEALRKTLFIDHRFVAGHFHLGMLLLRNKQLDAGLKSLRNALSISKRMNPTENVPGSQGLSYGRLIQILSYEMDLYDMEQTEHANESK